MGLFENFNIALLRLEFFASPNDTIMLTYKSSHGYSILLLYIDDMIVIGNDSLLFFCH